MAAAAHDAVVLHCLPAHRGEEISARGGRRPQSVVWQQAANRMHAMRGLLAWVSGPPGSTAAGRRCLATKHQRQHRITKLLETKAVGSQAPPGRPAGRRGDRGHPDHGVARSRGARRRQGARSPGARRPTPCPSCPSQQVAPEDHLRRVLGEWVVEVDYSGNLIVLRTPPGSAHVVGSALDRSGFAGVIGTVAGDDTVLVVASEASGGAAVAERLAAVAGIEPVARLHVATGDERTTGTRRGRPRHVRRDQRSRARG